MIDLNKDKDKNDITIRSHDDYLKALTSIGKTSEIKSEMVLKIIDEICLYERLNFDKINKNWLK